MRLLKPVLHRLRHRQRQTSTCTHASINHHQQHNTIHSLTHTHFLLPAMRVKSADAAVAVAVAVAVAAGVAAHTVRMNEA